eukprot:scaffold10831_cov129-Isochrysis_galbana.AAC.1
MSAHGIPEPLVKLDGDAVGLADEEVDEPAALVLRDRLQHAHQRIGHAQPAILGRHRDGGHVAVPREPGTQSARRARALRLAQHIAHAPPVWRVHGEAVLRPLGEVLQIEAHSKGLSQWVQVDIVEPEQVKRREATHGGHGEGAAAIAPALRRCPRCFQIGADEAICDHH